MLVLSIFSVQHKRDSKVLHFLILKYFIRYQFNPFCKYFLKVHTYNLFLLFFFDFEILHLLNLKFLIRNQFNSFFKYFLKVHTKILLKELSSSLCCSNISCCYFLLVPTIFFSPTQKEEDITCLLMDSCHVQLSHLLTSIFSPE